MLLKAVPVERIMKFPKENIQKRLQRNGKFDKTSNISLIQSSFLSKNAVERPVVTIEQDLFRLDFLEFPNLLRLIITCNIFERGLLRMFR